MYAAPAPGGVGERRHPLEIVDISLERCYLLTTLPHRAAWPVTAGVEFDDEIIYNRYL